MKYLHSNIRGTGIATEENGAVVQIDTLILHVLTGTYHV